MYASSPILQEVRRVLLLVKLPDITDAKLKLLLLIYLSYCNIKRTKQHKVIFINPIFPDAISLENTSVTSATAYRLASIPLPDSSNIFSEVKAANAPIPDSVANCAELSSPNLSVILSAATPETLTLFSPSV